MTKKRVLAWSDASIVKTGFGVVSHHILHALWNTGKYDIDHLAINYHGNFVNRDEVPWQMVPSKTAGTDDPYGYKLFLRAVAEHDYDFIWILNDLHVSNKVVDTLNKILESKVAERKKKPIIINYYPVDCGVLPNLSRMLFTADINVTYNDYSIKQTVKTFPQLEGKIQKIYHGTDTEAFKPLSAEERTLWRREVFKIDDSTLLLVNVNRNSQRKQLPRSLLMFKEFRKSFPNSRLYLHTTPVEPSQNIDLYLAVQDLGLNTKTDVNFPVNYGPSNPLSDNLLNKIYNCADVVFSTTTGEGWGLSVSEAMGAGVPVVVPQHTSFPEMLGENNERGWMVPCREQCFIDVSGFRPIALTTDMVEAVKTVVAQPELAREKARLARDWAVANNWDTICNQWVRLFDMAEKLVVDKPVGLRGEIL